MENQELIARINSTEKQWSELSPVIVEAYSALLEEEDFWNPETGIVWSRPIFWQGIGAA